MCNLLSDSVSPLAQACHKGLAPTARTFKRRRSRLTCEGLEEMGASTAATAMTLKLGLCALAGLFCTRQTPLSYLFIGKSAETLSTSTTFNIDI